MMIDDEGGDDIDNGEASPLVSAFLLLVFLADSDSGEGETDLGFLLVMWLLRVVALLLLLGTFLCLLLFEYDESRLLRLRLLRRLEAGKGDKERFAL
jgi:hypothetical protein